MREIKFRAWGYDFKEMFYKVGIIDGSLFIAFDDLGYDEVSNCEEFHVMQYTGLKDKNGKEIYEGDILEIKHLMGCETGELIFKYGAFLFDDGGYSYLGDHLANSEYIKVIGNIYENPELMGNADD